MAEARFRLVTSLAILAAMAAVFLPAATDDLARYAALQMFLIFGSFFAWNAISAIRILRRGRRPPPRD